MVYVKRVENSESGVQPNPTKYCKGHQKSLPILDTLPKKNLYWLVDIPIDTKRLKD